MKFSLRNILLANALIAFGLGLILSDDNSKIKRQALQIQNEIQLIREAESWNRAVDRAELEHRLRGSLLGHQSIAVN